MNAQLKLKLKFTTKGFLMLSPWLSIQRCSFQVFCGHRCFRRSLSKSKFKPCLWEASLIQRGSFVQCFHNLNDSTSIVTKKLPLAKPSSCLFVFFFNTSVFVAYLQASELFQCLIPLLCGLKLIVYYNKQNIAP